MNSLASIKAANRLRKDQVARRLAFAIRSGDPIVIAEAWKIYKELVAQNAVT